MTILVERPGTLVDPIRAEMADLHGYAGLLSVLLMATPEMIDDDRLRVVVPEGLEAPGDLDAQIFETALLTFLHGHRLDMQGLAADLDISRSTLYRRVSDRDTLLGHVLWFLTRQAIAQALVAGEGRHGRDRITSVIRRFTEVINGFQPFARFLDQEPEAALRVLTSPDGMIQPPLVRVVRRLLDQETASGHLDLSIDHETIAFVIIRIGESFLYSDVIASGEPDIDLAVEVVNRLLAEPDA